MDRPTAWGHLVTNLAVLPGLGSVMAGRRVGYLQAALALAGMTLSLLFVGSVVLQWWLVRGWPQVTVRWVLLGLGGMGVFLSGWCWSLVTSLSLLREAKAEEENRPPILDSSGR